MPTAAVGDTFTTCLWVAFLDGGILVVECAVGAVGLDSDNRLEDLLLQLFHLVFRLTFFLG